MTRLRTRTAMGVGGVVVGGLIWASAVLSQDDRNPPVPGASLEVRPDEPKAPATGSPTGTTRALGLPAPSPQPTVDPNPPESSGADIPGSPEAVPTAGSGLFFFGAGVPGMPSPEQAVQAETPALHIFKLKRVNARSLKEIVETLVPTARGHVAIDASTNTLILRAPDSVFAEVEPLINELDSLEERRAEPFSGGAAKGRGNRGGTGFYLGSAGPGGGAGFSGMSRGVGSELLGEPTVTPQVSATERKKDYERADKAARDFAATMKSNSNRDDDSMASLRNRVAYAFSLRQTLVRVELAEMQRRMTAIQESIDLRDRAAQQIIERRVSELLDPNLQWEPASTPAIGPGGFIDSNGVQWPRPGGMGPGAEGAGGSSSSSSNGNVSFTSPPVPNVPSNPGIGRGPGGSVAANPAVGSLSPDRAIHNRREVTLHIESEPRGFDQHTPAIVMEQNPTRTLLVSASWGIETFLLEKDRRPVISYKVGGADRPVDFVAGDLNLGIAIFSVPTSLSNRLTPWPKDEISEVRVGNTITYGGASHRVISLDQAFGRRVQNFELGLNGAFVFAGRIDGSPGAVLLRNDKLAGILLDSAESAAGEAKSYALPAQALFDRFHQLLEKNNNPNERSPSGPKVSDARTSGSSAIVGSADETTAGPGSIGSGDKSDASTSAATEGADDVAKISKMGPVLMLHMSAPWRGAERDAPAIVIDANEQRSILLSASWSGQRFPIGEEGAPVESMTLGSSKLPVQLIAMNETLGVAIYSVPAKLTTWPADQVSADVRVGDVLDELAIAGHGSGKPPSRHRVVSIDDVFSSGTSIPKGVAVDGTFVFEERMSGNPGTILLKDGKLAGMFLDVSQSENASGHKPHALPTKTLLERAHFLIEREEGGSRKLIQR